MRVNWALAPYYLAVYGRLLIANFAGKEVLKLLCHMGFYAKKQLVGISAPTLLRLLIITSVKKWCRATYSNSLLIIG
jgi:hypothetical protein